MTSPTLTESLLYAHLFVMASQVALCATLVSAERLSSLQLKVWYGLVGSSMTTGALWLDLHRATYAHRAWPWLYLGLALLGWGWVEWRLVRGGTLVTREETDE